MLVPLLALALVASPADEAHALPKPKSGDEMGFGISVARRGLWNEARFRFEKAVALNPENAHALNNLAVALEQQGIFDKAREAYEKALKLEPNNALIKQNFDLFKEINDRTGRTDGR